MQKINYIYTVVIITSNKLTQHQNYELYCNINKHVVLQLYLFKILIVWTFGSGFKGGTNIAVYEIAIIECLAKHWTIDWFISLHLSFLFEFFRWTILCCGMFGKNLFVECTINKIDVNLAIMKRNSITELFSHNT